MLISKTPYRISFFGGGTDYPSWYKNHGGSVISTTIDKYCYITARWLPPFHAEKSRIVWSKIEAVSDNSQIEHPAVRECLKYLGINDGVEIHHTGDLPARSGLGSSSAFTVGLLNVLRTMQHAAPTKKDLANEAIHIERDVMKENVGVQDQIACAHGGFNKVDIDPSGGFNVLPMPMSLYMRRRFQEHLLLFFTGISRTASHIAEEQIRMHQTKERDSELHTMRQMVDEAWRIMNKPQDWFEDFGKLLHESWCLKKSIASNISSDVIDDIYNKARLAGAWGGKLLGAGGGGFMLVAAPEDRHIFIRNALKNLVHVPFSFENSGSVILRSKV